MPKTPIKADRLAAPSRHFSQALLTAPGRLLFISGMVARSADGAVVGIGDVSAQTHQVCENIKAVVEAAGGTLQDVVRLDVYVRNIEHRDHIYAVRAEFFSDPLPTSTMVEVSKFVSPEFLVEITAIAVL